MSPNKSVKMSVKVGVNMSVKVSVKVSAHLDPILAGKALAMTLAREPDRRVGVW